MGWEDCHHPWSKGDKLFSPDALATHLKDGIIKKHRKQEILPKPPVDLPTRKYLPILGSLSPDIVRRNTSNAKEEIKLMEAAEKLMKELEAKDYGDIFADMQQRLALKVDNSLVGRKIGLLYEYYEPDGTALYCWAKGKLDVMPTEEEQSK